MDHDDKTVTVSRDQLVTIFTQWKTDAIAGETYGEDPAAAADYFLKLATTVIEPVG